MNHHHRAGISRAAVIPRLSRICFIKLNLAYLVLLRYLIIFGLPLVDSKFSCCVLLALSWNTNENLSTDKLSRAINYLVDCPIHLICNCIFISIDGQTDAVMVRT